MSAPTNIADLKNQGGQTGTQVARKSDFPAMLEKYKGEIAKALPKHLNADRMGRIALTAFRQTPKLGECDPRSVFAAVIQSSQLGLEVGLMGEAHLVPFTKRKKNGQGKWDSITECQLIPGYQGLMKLARNTGIVSDIYAHAVRKNDTFDIVLGLDQTLKHEPMKENGFPASDEARGPIVGFYAVAVFKDGTKHFEAMSTSQVEAIRDASNGYKAAVESAKKYNRETVESPWVQHFESMGLKTVLRKLCKYIPRSPELAQALAMDSQAEEGKGQNLELNEAIEGTWAPATDEPAETDTTGPTPPKQNSEPVVVRETQAPTQPQAPAETRTEGTVIEGQSTLFQEESSQGPTLMDALDAVRDGDFELARDLARNLTEQEQAIVESSITSRTKPQAEAPIAEAPQAGTRTTQTRGPRARVNME